MQNHTVALMGLLLCLALAMAGATGAAGGAHVTIPLDLAPFHNEFEYNLEL